MEFINRLLHIKKTGVDHNNSFKPDASKNSEILENNKCGKSDIRNFNKCLTDAESFAEQNVKYKNNEDILHPNEMGDISSGRVVEEEDVYEDAKENILSLTMLAENLNMIHLGSPFKPCSNNKIIHEFSGGNTYCTDDTDCNAYCTDDINCSVILGNKQDVDKLLNEDRKNTLTYLRISDNLEKEESPKNFSEEQPKCSTSTALVSFKDKKNYSHLHSVDSCEISPNKIYDAHMEYVSPLNFPTEVSLNKFILNDTELICENVIPDTLESPFKTESIKLPEPPNILSKDTDEYISEHTNIEFENNSPNKHLLLPTNLKSSWNAIGINSNEKKESDGSHCEKDNDGNEFKKNVLHPLNSVTWLGTFPEHNGTKEHKNERTSAVIKDTCLKNETGNTFENDDDLEDSTPIILSCNLNTIEKNQVNDHTPIFHLPVNIESECNNVHTLQVICEKKVSECNTHNSVIVVGSSMYENGSFEFNESKKEMRVNENIKIDSNLISREVYDITSTMNNIKDSGNQNSGNDELSYQLDTFRDDIEVTSGGENQIQYNTYAYEECDVNNVINNDKSFSDPNIEEDIFSHQLKTLEGNDMNIMENGLCEIQPNININVESNITNHNNNNKRDRHSDSNDAISIAVNYSDQEVQDPAENSVTPFDELAVLTNFTMEKKEFTCDKDKKQYNVDSEFNTIANGEIVNISGSNICCNNTDLFSYLHKNEETNSNIKEKDFEVSNKTITCDIIKKEIATRRVSNENGTHGNDNSPSKICPLLETSSTFSNSNGNEHSIFTEKLLFDERVTEAATNISEQINNTRGESQDSDSDGDIHKVVITNSYHDENNSKSSGSKNSIELMIDEAASNCKSNNSLCGQDISSVSKSKKSMHSLLPVYLNQSEAGPITAADELSTDDLGFQDGANLDLDFFTQVGSIEGVLRNSLTRDSLYVKFDPIVSKIVSKTNNRFIMSLSGEERKREEGRDSTITVANNTLQEDLEGRCEIISPILESDKKLISLTPPSTSSVSESPNKVGQGNFTAPFNVTMSQEQLQKELKKLEDITKEREIYFQNEISKANLNLEKKEIEFRDMDSKKSALENELKASTEREIKLKKELIERTKSKQQLSLVMEEYEKTISQLVAQKEVEKKEFEVQKDLLMKERDTAMQHLNNMEIAFNDIHQKYERSKTVIEGMKANEDSLKKSLVEYDEAIKSNNAKYESLKNHAISQLETANQELDIMRRTHEAEIAKLKAMLKKAEVRVTSLEESLEQKSKENQELAAICDELINKVGSSGN